MKKHSLLCSGLVLLLLITFLHPLLNAEDKNDAWKKWLSEVDIIMTGSERSVAKQLLTVEERQRFQNLFWKSRDTTPNTPENEFQMEFYRRIAYAHQNLHGPNSDRGRIYILLGKPTNLNHFNGYQDLVECELWNYENSDKPGILPFMNIVFFKSNDSGDFQLYTPGIHSPNDLLSPQWRNRVRSKYNAYQTIKENSSELASASLSIVPGEGDPRGGTLITSSNYALNRIYSLPEREVEASYIHSFQSPSGEVQVTQTTHEIMGYGYITVLPNNNLHFLHYALCAEALNLKQVTPDQFQAEIQLFVSIEKENGGIVYQDRRVIPFQADAKKRKNIQERKVVFRDFIPILEGNYHILLTFLNVTTQEFFTYKNSVSVSSAPGANAAVIGYQLKEFRPTSFLPFATDDYLMLVDPGANFSQKESLEGVVHTTQPPQVYLEKTGAAIIPIDITPAGPQRYFFRKPLKEVPDGTYFLNIKTSDNKKITEKIHILPYYIEITRPFVMEHPEPKTSWFNYVFVLAQQYLAIGDTKRALAYCQQIPQNLWNASSLPIIAKIYYTAQDYTQTIKLLERPEVKKEYPVLLMLANSSIELKHYVAALQYLQKIRQYGDTVEINQLIAATYLNLGDHKNAKTYYERAKKLKDSLTTNNQQKKPQETE